MESCLLLTKISLQYETSGLDHEYFSETVSRLIGEGKWYEDDFAKCVTGFGSHGDGYSLSYSASLSLSQTAAKLATAV
jgi:hypothetical protein